MAPARPRTLFDYHRFNANVRVTCPECGRSTVYATRDMVGYFLAKRWNAAIEVAGCHFKCDGCGHKGARISMAPMETEPSPPRPAPIARERR